MKPKIHLDVHPDQLWESLKSGERDRRIRIKEVRGENAICLSWRKGSPSAPRVIRVRLTRFNPRADGFRLVEEKA